MLETKKIKSNHAKASKKTKHILPPKKSAKTNPITRSFVKTRVLATFGWNEDKQLGLPPGIIEQRLPMRVESLDNVLTCAAGGQHMAVIDKKGNMHTWGCNDLGGLGRKTKDDECDTAESQEEEEGKPVIVQNNVVATNAGGGFTLSSTKNGEVWLHGCFRTYEGTFVREKVLGDSYDVVPCGTPQKLPIDGSKVRTFACGENFVAYISDVGELYVFGVTEELFVILTQEELFGKVFPVQRANGISIFDVKKETFTVPRQISNGAIGRSFIACAAGKYHLIALAKSRDGSISVWAGGRNDQGQLGLGNALAQNKMTRVTALDGKGIVSVSAGSFHTVYTDEFGSIWVCGQGMGVFGQGNDGSCRNDNKQLIPIKFRLPGEEIVEVACGDSHTLLRTKSNKVFTLGRGDFGKLGHGNESPCDLPKEIDFKKSGFHDVDIHSIHAGFHHSAVICSVGSFESVKHSGSKFDDTYDFEMTGTAIKNMSVKEEENTPHPQFTKWGNWRQTPGS